MPYKYSFPGAGQGLSGFGSFLPKRNGIAVVVGNIGSLSVLFDSKLAEYVDKSPMHFQEQQPIDWLWVCYETEDFDEEQEFDH